MNIRPCCPKQLFDLSVQVSGLKVISETEQCSGFKLNLYRIGEQDVAPW